MKTTYKRIAETNGKHALQAIANGSVNVAGNYARCAAHYANKHLKKMESK